MLNSWFKYLLYHFNPSIHFIFEPLSNEVNFLDVNCKLNNSNNTMNFDIYHKPTNSFTYLHNNSSHPEHTKNNIALSLAQRIIRITNINTDENINQLKINLINRGHEENTINESLSKVFSPTEHQSKKDLLTFTHTFSPGLKFNKNNIKNCLDGVKDENIKKHFQNKQIMITTKQPKNLRELLTRAKFDPEKPMTQNIREITGLSKCTDERCFLHKKGYMQKIYI